MIALFDANNVVYSLLHKMEGLPDHDVTVGLVRSLARVCRSVRAYSAYLVWDGGISPRRRVILPGYKVKEVLPQHLAAVEEMRRRYKYQRWLMTELAPLVSIRSILCDGVEADDVIARAVDKLGGSNVIIVSKDRDFAQLVSPTVRVYRPNPFGGEWIEHTETMCRGRVLMYRALLGDHSDRIPGVPGVGEVTAGIALSGVGVREAYRDTEAMAAFVEWCAANSNSRIRGIAANARIVLRNFSLMDLSRERLSAAHDHALSEALFTGRSVVSPTMACQLLHSQGFSRDHITNVIKCFTSFASFSA